MVVAHDSLHDHHAQSVARILGREVGLEYPGDVLGLDAFAGVCEHEENVFRILSPADTDPSAAGHGLDRVFQNVEVNLLELVRVGGNGGCQGLQIDNHLDPPFLEKTALNFEDLAEHGDQIDLPQVGWMGADGREKVGDDAVEPFDLARADFEGFGRAIDDLRRFELLDLPTDELQVDGQGIQRIPQFVRHPGGERHDRGDFLVFDQFLCRVFQLGNVRKDHYRTLDEPMFAGVLERHQVHSQDPGFRVVDLDFARGGEALRIGRFRIDLKGVGQLRNSSPDVRPPDLAAAQGEEAEGRLVGVLDDALAVEDEDTVAYDVEHALEQVPVTDQPLHEDGEVVLV